MEIQKPAIAGTLESNDVQIVAEPFMDGIQLLIENSVMNQHGRQIKATVLETLEYLGVKNGKITVNDKSALGCVLEMRVECVVFHGCGASEKNILWGGVVR